MLLRNFILNIPPPLLLRCAYNVHLEIFFGELTITSYALLPLSSTIIYQLIILLN